MNQEEKELTGWEAWLTRNDTAHHNTTAMLFDKLCELAVTNYTLDSKSQNQDLKDRMHFFILWWGDNKSKSEKYYSSAAMDKLLKKKHGTTYHYLNRRKKSYRYEENTECIRDFLES